jgi:hypothetical protein
VHIGSVYAAHKCSLEVFFSQSVPPFGENVLGWGEKQLPDGTLILTSPAGHTYVTTPGSALLFSSLCLSTGGIPAPEADPPPDARTARTAESARYAGPAPPDTDEEPPPF